MQKTSEADRLTGHTTSNRRSSKRIVIVFQIEVSGLDHVTGSVFHDRAATSDISEDGCQFTFHRKLSPGEHLSLGLVDTDFARVTGHRTQPFEVVWVERGRIGWTVGARKLEGNNIWPITFPLRA
jgi:hypothetical protein